VSDEKTKEKTLTPAEALAKAFSIEKTPVEPKPS